MKLVSFQVRNYRNILDSTEVTVQGDVTTLVGMNESGKSAMLDALYRLNPVYGDSFVERDDYPRWRWKRDGRTSDLTKASPIEAKFVLEEADQKALADVLGPGVVTDTSVTVGRQYDGTLWVRIEVDEHKLVKQILDGHPNAKELAKQSDTLSSLRQVLSAETGPSSSHEDQPDHRPTDDQQLLERLNERFGSGYDPQAQAKSVIEARLPKFFRFASYQNLEGRVDVRALRVNQGERPGASSKQTARALLLLADTDIDAITDEEFESRTAELEAVSSDLSREMKEYWSTNPELRIRVEIESVTETDHGGRKSVVRYLNFRVEDRKHDFTNNFAQRSSGYQWFFSFLAAFSEFENLNEDVIILLDEPALTLHAKAQRDFLRFINERLAPVGQVIYTTHSPFMVEQIERVRIVEDRGGDIGSITSSDALAVGEESAFPLQAALGYDLSQNLFIGEHNLLVEGPSDLVYLDVISRHLRSIERHGLDERWRILPAGGASNVPAFVALLGRKVAVTVLLDSGTEGSGRVEAAIKANRIDGQRVVFVGEVLKQQHSDIEDLFSADDYLELYNAAFGKSHGVGDLPGHADRIIKRLESLDGKFDHWRPAETLLRDPDAVGRLSVTTLDNFERLANRISATERPSTI